MPCSSASTPRQAIADLRELIVILQESKGDFKELRATFEELAKTESDCSSAKRGGDLGFFGRSEFCLMLFCHVALCAKFIIADLVFLCCHIRRFSPFSPLSKIVEKMQPAFEKASFGLKVGQLSDIVDTSSGVHVILRLA